MNIEQVSTGKISWARYWGLECLKDVLKCTTVEAHTCPFTLRTRSLNEKTIDRCTIVTLDGVCTGKKFKVTCPVLRRSGKGDWNLGKVIVAVNGEMARIYDSMEFLTVVRKSENADLNFSVSADE